MLGVGAPETSQAIWASLPSKTVTLAGGLINSGEEAKKEKTN